ncbi:MAG: hypothetical protein ACI8ZM_005645, partial [Crocinitomix sp.]
MKSVAIYNKSLRDKNLIKNCWEKSIFIGTQKKTQLYIVRLYTLPQRGRSIILSA